MPLTPLAGATCEARCNVALLCRFDENRGKSSSRPAYLDMAQLSISPTSASLLVRIRDPADDAAWRVFVELYAPFLFRICRRQGLDANDSEDVTQEVLIQVSRWIRSFRYDPAKGKFRNYLRRCLVRQLRRWKKRPGRGRGGDENLSLLETLASPRQWDEAFLAYLRKAAEERIRGEFDETTWAAFEHVELRRQTPAEAAAALGQRVGWVYKALAKVSRRLADEVERLASDTVWAA